MNHPVLLPKRKQFGFLRGPKTSSTNDDNYLPASKTSKLDQFSFKITRTKEFITNTIKPVSSPLSYEFNKLKLSYELKTPCWIFDKNHKNDYIGKLKMNRNGSFRRGVNCDQSCLEERQAYSYQSGTNLKNLKATHHYLNVYSKPIKPTSGLSSSANNEQHSHDHLMSQKCLVCRFKETNATSDQKSRPNESVTLEKSKITQYRSRPRLNSKEIDENKLHKSIDFNSYDGLLVDKSNNSDSNFAFKKELESDFQLNDDNDELRKDNESPRPKLTLWLV